MTPNDDDVRAGKRQYTSQYVGAIARWENEGGASRHDSGESGGKSNVKPARVNPHGEDGEGVSDSARAIVLGPERQS